MDEQKIIEEIKEAKQIINDIKRYLDKEKDNKELRNYFIKTIIFALSVSGFMFLLVDKILS